MSNRKSCIKCGRSIDEFARVCPYCNWWQSQPVPAHQPAAVLPAPASLDPRTQKSLLGVLTFGFLMMVAFTVGSLFHGATPAKAAQQQAQPAASAPATPSTPRVSVTLIPVNEGAPLTAPDAPVTSVSPQDATSTTGGGTDATALPSEQYNAAAAKMQQASQQPTGTMIDPRSITGSPYEAPAPRPARPRQPRATATVETQPVPLFQPVPHVRTDRDVTVQLSLVVGTDGRVHDIDIQRGAPGVMGPLIGDVQQWRFRPATQDGQPVSSRFTVAVTFRP
jgi:hypothetical protein